MPRELKNLPAVLKNVGAWGMTPTELEAQVKRIHVKFEWAKPKREPAPISFLSWLKTDPKRCPSLWFALVEHSETYLGDPKFEHMNLEAWEEFANVHGVTGEEFRPAWRQYRASQRRNGIALVN
jgi:hypothetical protein